MVLMVAENWWPAGKSQEIGKLYLEVMKKFPVDKSIEKPMVRGALYTKEGYTYSITISSIKPGKVKESMDLATNRLLMLSSIEGYRYNIHIAYDLVEAMPIVGLKAPE